MSNSVVQDDPDSTGDHREAAMPIVWIPTKEGCEFKGLIDTASTTSFVTVGILYLLEHEFVDAIHDVKITSMHGSKSVSCRKALVHLPCGALNHKIMIPCLVVDVLPTIHYPEFRPSKMVSTYLEDFNLNAPFPQTGGVIDMLIGISDLWQIVKGIKARLNEHFVVLDTVYGDVPCGLNSRLESLPTYGNGNSTDNPPQLYADNLDKRKRRSAATFLTATESLTKAVEKMWKVDSFPRDDSDTNLTMDEIRAVEAMDENLVFDKDVGRFRTRLLWGESRDLVNNFHQAKARLRRPVETPAEGSFVAGCVCCLDQ